MIPPNPRAGRPTVARCARTGRWKNQAQQRDRVVWFRPFCASLPECARRSPFDLCAHGVSHDRPPCASEEPARGGRQSGRMGQNLWQPRKEPRMNEGSPDEGQSEMADDILDLNDPERGDRTLGRLGLLVLGVSAALFLFSFLLMAILATGSVLDLLVLILWLGGTLLAIAGAGLLAIAGIEAVRRKVPPG